MTNYDRLSYQQHKEQRNLRKAAHLESRYDLMHVPIDTPAHQIFGVPNTPSLAAHVLKDKIAGHFRFNV